MANKYKVVDETGQAMRIFDRRSEATRFLQEGWRILLIKGLSPYEIAVQRVGYAVI